MDLLYFALKGALKRVIISSDAIDHVNSPCLSTSTLFPPTSCIHIEVISYSVPDMSQVTANAPPSNPSPPTAALKDGAPSQSTRRRQAHALQVQAFLNAADEVDIDEEIAEDLLDGLEGDINFGDEIEVDIEDDNEDSGLDPEVPLDVETDGTVDGIPEDGEEDDGPEAAAIEEEGAYS